MPVNLLDVLLSLMHEEQLGREFDSTPPSLG